MPATKTTIERFPKSTTQLSDVESERDLSIQAGAVRSTIDAASDPDNYILTTEWNIPGQNDTPAPAAPTGQNLASPPPVSQEPALPEQTQGVPFAATSTETRYWPILSTDARGREVTYTDINGGKHGSNPGRRFFADRDGGARHHVAVDLYGNAGDTVVAIEDGEIVHFYSFYNGVWALIVQCNADLVINYGEVDARSLARYGLQKGSVVRAGQPIGFIGRSTTGSMMCHFETYVTGTISNQKWMAGQPAPSALLNPTAYLLELARSGR